jgi:maltooligosyltrehalose trehalohydrolase
VLAEYYRALLALRRELAPIVCAERDTMHVVDLPHERIVCIHYWTQDEDVFVVLAFGDARVEAESPLPKGAWRKRFDSAELEWNGPGSTIPDEIVSSGRASVVAEVQSCFVFQLLANR